MAAPGDLRHRSGPRGCAAGGVRVAVVRPYAMATTHLLGPRFVSDWRKNRSIRPTKPSHQSFHNIMYAYIGSAPQNNPPGRPATSPTHASTAGSAESRGFDTPAALIYSSPSYRPAIAGAFREVVGALVEWGGRAAEPGDDGAVIPRIRTDTAIVNSFVFLNTRES